MLEGELSSAVLRTITEAMTWCSWKPFRSPELNPVAILEIPDFSSGSESIGAWIEKKRDRYRRAISWINETRSELLKTATAGTPEAVDAVLRSKLLIYEPLETVVDGVSEAASMGFYDLHDAPPWDTWFLYQDGKVFCCIPDFAIHRAQAGIEINVVDCIHWGDWSSLARAAN